MSGRVTIVRGWANGATQSSQAIQFGRSVRVSDFTSHPLGKSTRPHCYRRSDEVDRSKGGSIGAAKIAAQFLRDIITVSVRPS